MNKNYLSSASQCHSCLLATAALGLVLLAAGCSFLKSAQNESRYYLLTSTSEIAGKGQTNDASQACVVRLRPVELADYLNTKDMAVRTGTNEITFSLFHRWAEPLDAGIRRVVAENLRPVPAIHRVLTDEPAPPGYPVYTISIRILACEGSRSARVGSALFEAVWEITGPDSQRGGSAGSVFRSQPTSWTPNDYGQLARQISRAVGDLSNVLVDSIARLTRTNPSMTKR